MRDVENFKAGDVLCCKYQGEQNEEAPHPYYFWYREAPAGLDELVKTLPPDHPIRLIGPPRYEAPANLELAMKANVETAQVVEKRLAAEKARALAPRSPAGTSYERGRDIVLGIAGLLLGAAAYHDATHHDSNSSGGGSSGPAIAPKKSICPICGGKGQVRNYDSSEGGWKTCIMCGGTGFEK
jgi:hypothetical protein